MSQPIDMRRTDYDAVHIEQNLIDLQAECPACRTTLKPTEGEDNSHAFECDCGWFYLIKPPRSGDMTVITQGREQA